VELFKLVLNVEQDVADEVEAMTEESLEGSADSFLKGIGC
jgi:hypothetical protein